jgi:hypothetical protein
MWKSLPAHSACPTAWWNESPAIVSWATSGLTPTSSGRSSVEMKCSAWPTVGRKMSPRGSFGLGSSAKRSPYPCASEYSTSTFSASR